MTSKLTRIIFRLNPREFYADTVRRVHTKDPPATLYMTPVVGLNLIATWIAVEDCDPDAGPLQYYPGSHKIPPFLFSNERMTAIGGEMQNYQKYMASEVEKRKLKAQTFCARKGDVFISHSQLFHGGSKILNARKARKSLVTHYFADQDIACLKAPVAQHGKYIIRTHQLA
jgi:phytanoyl-CoA hydroxylase